MCPLSMAEYHLSDHLYNLTMRSRFGAFSNHHVSGTLQPGYVKDLGEPITAASSVLSSFMSYCFLPPRVFFQVKRRKFPTGRERPQGIRLSAGVASWVDKLLRPKKRKTASVFITALLTTFVKCIALKKHWIKYRCHIGATISC